MLLIHMVLRWLIKPVALAIDITEERATVAFPAVLLQAVRQHHIGLAPIHAPPLRLTS
jgi:hypothetical protein